MRLCLENKLVCIILLHNPGREALMGTFGGWGLGRPMMVISQAQLDLLGGVALRPAWEVFRDLSEGT